MKQLNIKGGLLSKAEAMQYQQSLTEDTIMVSVSSPTGLPITPLCYIPVGKSLLTLIEAALDDPYHTYSIDPINVRETSEFDVVQATDLYSDEPEQEDPVIMEINPDEPEELESVLSPESIETVEVEIAETPMPKPARKKKEKVNG